MVIFPLVREKNSRQQAEYSVREQRKNRAKLRLIACEAV